MITVQEAVKAATSTIRELYPDQKIDDIALEEVELGAPQLYWLITMGFTVTVDRPTTGTLGDYLSGWRQVERKYKVFKVNAETGKVESMKIRKT